MRTLCVFPRELELSAQFIWGVGCLFCFLLEAFYQALGSSSLFIAKCNTVLSFIGYYCSMLFGKHMYKEDKHLDFNLQLAKH